MHGRKRLDGNALELADHARRPGTNDSQSPPSHSAAADIRSRNLLLCPLIEDDDLVAGVTQTLQLRSTPLAEQTQVLGHAVGDVRQP
jgi:hypothetical protein